MNFLKSAVASAIAQGPAFPYTFGDRVDIDQSIWTLQNGTKRVGTLARSMQYTAEQVTSGRWIEMQYILLRRCSQQVTTTPRKELPKEVPHVKTPWDRTSAGYG